MLPLSYRTFELNMIAIAIVMGILLLGEIIPPLTASPRRTYNNSKSLVVDLTAVYSQSQALQSIKSQLKQWTRAFQEIAQHEENNLKKKWALLEKEKKIDITAKGERTPEKKAFDEQFSVFLKLHRQRPEALEKAHLKAVQILKKTLSGILETIAKHEQVTHILRVQSLAWLDENRIKSVTQRVLTRINTLLPYVKLEVPAKELGITRPPCSRDSR